MSWGMFRIGLLRLTLAITVLGFAHVEEVFAEELSAADLLAKSDRSRGGGLPGLIWQVQLSSRERDENQERGMIVKANASSSFVEFNSPERVKGHAILMLGRNMWFNRPGLSKPIPISPRQRLIGQAANGDIAATNYSQEYFPVLVRTETYNGEAVAVLDLTSIDGKSTYSRIRYWVSLTRHLGLKAEFYTVSQKLMKTATFKYDNSIVANGLTIPFVSEMKIFDATNSDHVTSLKYSNIQVAKLGPETFKLNTN